MRDTVGYCSDVESSQTVTTHPAGMLHETELLLGGV